MAGSLELIKSETLSGSVANVSVTDVFSDKYDVYKITMNNFSTASSTATETILRFINSSDTIVTNSNYDYAYLQMLVASSFTENRDTGQDKITAMLAPTDFPPEGNVGIFYVFNPFSSSSYTFVTSRSANSHNGTRAGWKGIAVLKETTSITGLNIFLSSTNPTNESYINVYGVK